MEICAGKKVENLSSSLSQKKKKRKEKELYHINVIYQVK
jgi:hypothetical protein